MKGQDIVEMIQHWLACPPNGYFGQDYGAPTAILLLNPLSAPVADEFIRKMRNDIPVLNLLGPDELAIEAHTQGHDIRLISIRVRDTLVPVGEPTQTTREDWDG